MAFPNCRNAFSFFLPLVFTKNSNFGSNFLQVKKWATYIWTWKSLLQVIDLLALLSWWELQLPILIVSPATVVDIRKISLSSSSLYAWLFCLAPQLPFYRPAQFVEEPPLSSNPLVLENRITTTIFLLQASSIEGEISTTSLA